MYIRMYVCTCLPTGRNPSGLSDKLWHSLSVTPNLPSTPKKFYNNVLYVIALRTQTCILSAVQYVHMYLWSTATYVHTYAHCTNIWINCTLFDLTCLIHHPCTYVHTYSGNWLIQLRMPVSRTMCWVKQMLGTRIR